MAQHDFAPAWLSFPTPPSSTKSALSAEKHSEGLARLDGRHNVIRRRHNSSDAFDAAHGRSGGGHFGRKEKSVWRSQGRNGSENINHGGTQNGTGSRSRSGTSHGGKSPGHREGSASESDATRKDDRDRRKQFEAEDFPSLNPEHEKEFNQNKSVAAGVWEYPLNSRSRPSRMLVIRKGTKDDFSLSGYPISTSSRASAVKSEGDTPKSQAPKESSPTQEQSCLQVDKHELQNLDSSNEIYRPNQCAHPDSPDMSQTSVEEDVDDCSLQNRTLHQGDINLNFDQGEIPQGNENSFTSRQITRSSAFPQEDVLSSSLEAEHRLLKEMGWQEDIGNDETYAPLTEDEMREVQAISEQLQKNGLRKNGLLRNGLSLEFRFDPWKRSTFRSTYEDDDTETSSSSDTSDDDDYYL